MSARVGCNRAEGRVEAVRDGLQFLLLLLAEKNPMFHRVGLAEVGCVDWLRYSSRTHIRLLSPTVRVFETLVTSVLRAFHCWSLLK